MWKYQGKETLVTVEPGPYHFPMSAQMHITHGNLNVSDQGFVQSTDSSGDSCDVDYVGYNPKI